jgi:CRISPR/Cas system-associated exonuclease Cas4 (RecB family)
MTSFGRRLENSYIAIFIEAIEAAIEIPFDSTLISNLNTNKNIQIRRITAVVDSSGVLRVIFKQAISLNKGAPILLTTSRLA